VHGVIGRAAFNVVWLLLGKCCVTAVLVGTLVAAAAIISGWNVLCFPPGFAGALAAAAYELEYLARVIFFCLKGSGIPAPRGIGWLKRHSHTHAAPPFRTARRLFHDVHDGERSMHSWKGFE